MLTRLRTAGLVWPTLLSIPALILLISLGNWQMSRKVWKDALIARIEAGLKAAPIPLDEALRATPREFPEYTRVKLQGRFEHDAERYFYAPDPQLGPGYHVYTPLLMANGKRVIVNRGFVPDALRSPASWPAGQVEGTVELVGLLRPNAPPVSVFTPDNDPARNIWFRRDVLEMTDCRQTPSSPGSSVKETPYCRSFENAFVDAEAEPANPGGWPRGGTTNLDIPNRHLEYVLTWYGLAATLVAMYLAFAVSRLRETTKS